MTPIYYTDKDPIIERVAERYCDWRDKYGAPRTTTATRQMIKDILEPLFNQLDSWDAHEDSAQQAIEKIKEILGVQP